MPEPTPDMLAIELTEVCRPLKEPGTFGDRMAHQKAIAVALREAEARGAAREREEIAKMVEDFDSYEISTLGRIADAIRARANVKPSPTQQHVREG